MKKIYQIYLDNYKLKTLPLSYLNWCTLIFIYIDKYYLLSNKHEIIIGKLLSFTRYKLDDLNFNYEQDGGGTVFRLEILKNNNETIEQFNKLIKLIA